MHQKTLVKHKLHITEGHGIDSQNREVNQFNYKEVFWCTSFDRSFIPLQLVVWSVLRTVPNKFKPLASFQIPHTNLSTGHRTDDRFPCIFSLIRKFHLHFSKFSFTKAFDTSNRDFYLAAPQTKGIFCSMQADLSSINPVRIHKRVCEVNFRSIPEAPHPHPKESW